MSLRSRRTIRPIRTTTALAAAGLSLSLLAGCGGGGDTGAAEGGKGEPVTITFWGWAKGTQEVVDKFNATHDDIRVKYQQIPSGNAGGYAKIANSVKAGNAPDVFNVEYPQLPDFVSQGAVQDISAHMDKGLKDKYLPQATELTTLGGKTWALPLDVAPQVFFYRKDVFEQAGIEPPKTWEDFRTAAEKIKKEQPKARIATFFPDDPSTFEAHSWQAGARWFDTAGDGWSVDMTDKGTRRTAEYWQGMVEDDLLTVMPSFSQQWTSSLQKGTTVGYLGASWGAGVLQDTLPDQSGKWAIAPTPSWDGKPASGMVGGTTFAVSKDSEKAEAAVEFADWATTSAESVKARLSSGTSSSYPAAPALVPVAKKGFDPEYYGDQDVYGLFRNAAESIRQGWTWGPAMGGTNAALTDRFGKIKSGEQTFRDAVEEARKATVNEAKKRGMKVTTR